MSLTPGTRLGPYEIVSAIGAGGMGQVYKARDTRLGRDVAVKVLSAEFASDDDFRARFEREARSISALDHPNICTLYDVGHDKSTHYLVMQYLEGETLASRLEKGPLPIDQAVKTAVEICDALDKAHRHGITHRDLKPGNVMLTTTGTARSGLAQPRSGSTATGRSGSAQAKLLDFGLAKTAPAPVAGSAAATVMAAPHAGGQPLTARGMILGTFEYMSPEQIEGQEADARSDIWAFGCVLYEMLTGKRAFEGKSRASLIGAILKEQAPRVAAIQPLAPAGLDHVVATCLAKDPDDRWQSAADISRELQWVVSAPQDTAAAAVAAPAGPRRERLVWAAALVLAVAGTAAAVWFLKPSREVVEGPIVRATLPFASAEVLQLNPYPTIALSLDGKLLAYRGGVPAQIYVRALSDNQSRPLAGTEGGVYPFFSPDGTSLGYLDGRTIKRIGLGGGAPNTVVELTTTNLRGAAWGDDGNIYYTPTVSAGLWRIPAAGGKAEQLTTPDFAKGEKTHRFPFVLPGSKAVLFMVGTSRITSFDDARIEVLSLATRARHPLVEGGTYPQYVSSGHLLYTRLGKLLAVPFDTDRLTLSGSPTTVAEGMFVDTLYGTGNYGISRDGLFVRVNGGAVALPQQLKIVDRHGVEQATQAEARLYGPGRMAPDGTRFATYLNGATSQIHVFDLLHGNTTQLTYEWDNETAVWSPDGTRIVFVSNRGGGPRNLHVMRAVDGGGAQRLLTSPNEQQAYSWSRDGVIAYIEFNPTSGADIFTTSVDSPKAQLFVGTPAEETLPSFSPDGHWIAYQSNQSGRPEVYVQSYPAPGGRTKVSNGGGTQPLWQKSGNEIVYRLGQSVMAVEVGTTPEFHTSAPVKLFDSANLLYDVLPDGRLLMRTTSPPPPVTELELVVNWFQELRKKVAK